MSIVLRESDLEDWHTFEVTRDAARLDQFLAQELSLSRTVIQAQLRKQEIYVNDHVGKASQAVKIGDVVRYHLYEQVSHQISPEKMDLDILYEDNHILVINKPRGLLVHPGARQFTGTLVHGLLAHTTQLSDIGGEERPGIVHRLDQETEGLMVIAKTNDAHQNLSDQFKQRCVIKKYYAMVYGNLKQDELRVDEAIGRHAKDRFKMSVRHVIPATAKEAISELRVLKRYNTKTLVEVMPKTGRTHQIRVHLAFLGHPVVGDPLYSVKKKGDGQLLQAYYLSFQHPVSKKTCVFERPLSKRLGILDSSQDKK
ncbi:RNA pseudouridine synthase [Candidatus Marinamargulisbacteria bacterium SCGC AG-439-L15]|nr:RNA pseudouridine synthase [Candidatus Marinamargulisbacteria bacterium SCGC AG-439-L15]